MAEAYSTNFIADAILIKILAIVFFFLFLVMREI
jgi:hypothetical protein